MPRCALAILCLVIAVLPPAQAEEVIRSFHSEIAIHADATMTVTETIRVKAEGRSIRRGIYRDFPTRYRDRYGNHYVVGFDVIDVTRDGSPEPWHQEKRANGVRVYAGSSDAYLAPGEYAYAITYRSNRQLGFFDGHDELYWNVTGNGWAFPIEKAIATVQLPAQISTGDITLSGFTGPQGSTEKRYSASIHDGGGTIRADRLLAAGEGLTLVMTWPKGVVTPPGPWQLFLYMLSDNRGLLLALLALLGSVAYLLLMWHRHGRDPAPGVIFPHYEPPPGYSPASARFIGRMGYDNKVLSAAVINLAVKGHVAITHHDKKYTLKRLACNSWRPVSRCCSIDCSTAAASWSWTTRITRQFPQHGLRISRR